MSNDAPKYPNRAAQLRARLLNQAVPPNRPIIIDGEEYWIRTPLLEDGSRITEMAGQQMKAVTNPKTGEVSIDLSKVPMANILAAACIVLAVDAVGSPIFTQVDFETLSKTHAGSSIAKLGQACWDAASGEKKEEAAKAPAPITSSASTSSSPTV